MMSQRCLSVMLCAMVSALGPIGASAQTVTYHLHKEASKTAGLLQLKTAPPDSAATTIASTEMRNQPAGTISSRHSIPRQECPTPRDIPAGSVVSVTLWMKKSANAAAMYPRARMHVNSAAGSQLCAATGSTALTTTISAHVLSCRTAEPVSMNAADRFYLWVGITVSTAAGKTRVKGQPPSRAPRTALTTRASSRRCRRWSRRSRVSRPRPAPLAADYDRGYELRRDAGCEQRDVQWHRGTANVVEHDGDCGSGPGRCDNRTRGRVGGRPDERPGAVHGDRARKHQRPDYSRRYGGADSGCRRHRCARRRDSHRDDRHQGTPRSRVLRPERMRSACPRKVTDPRHQRLSTSRTGTVPCARSRSRRALCRMRTTIWTG